MEVTCVTSKPGHNCQSKTHQSPLSLSQMTFDGMKHSPCQPMMNIHYEGGINRCCFKPLRLGGGGICYCNITQPMLTGTGMMAHENLMQNLV